MSQARGCPVGPSSGPLRLSACGASLIPTGGRLPAGGPAQPLILSGVNMWLHYYHQAPPLAPPALVCETTSQPLRQPCSVRRHSLPLRSSRRRHTTLPGCGGQCRRRTSSGWSACTGTMRCNLSRLVSPVCWLNHHPPRPRTCRTRRRGWSALRRTRVRASPVLDGGHRALGGTHATWRYCDSLCPLPSLQRRRGRDSA